MSEITPDQRAVWREHLEDGTAFLLMAGDALALLAALDAAEAQRADVLAFLRELRESRLPSGLSGESVTHSEDCWAWHTPCLATKIRRMLGDET